MNSESDMKRGVSSVKHTMKPTTFTQWCVEQGKILDDRMIWTRILTTGYVKKGYLYYDGSSCSTPSSGIDSGIALVRHGKPHWKRVKINMDSPP